MCLPGKNIDPAGHMYLFCLAPFFGSNPASFFLREGGHERMQSLLFTFRENKIGKKSNLFYPPNCAFCKSKENEIVFSSQEC